MGWLHAARSSGAGRSRAQVSRVFSLSAPVGGLNARDGYTEMGPSDAVRLDNWFPEAQYCVTRGGSVAWATGLGGAVHTLMTWRSLSGSDKLFAARGTSIYEATSAGVAPVALAGLTNPDWQWTNIQTSAGLFLMLANGADSVRSYDGTAWAVPVITGVTSSTLINVMLFKQRLWFVQKNTLDLWYLPTSSIAGVASQFPLGAVFRKGGSITAIGSFSRDAGDGPDDFLAVVTSNGEVAVYEGIDPASSTTFSLSGLFEVGKPIGRRCMARLNGDLGIVTYDGVISMQSALQFDRASDQKAAITGKIQTLFGQLTRQYGTYAGWQSFVYPKARYYIVNYPVVADMQQCQLVMNTVTGAWCTFSGLNAGCWGSANDSLFFGGNDGKVYSADTLNSDSGADIVADMKCAFNAFKSAEKKMITALKPILLTGGGVDLQTIINWDFDDTPPSGSATATPVSGAIWGAMLWPWTWGGSGVIDARWHTAGGVGVWAAVRLRVAVSGAYAQLNAFNVLVQKGGPF